MTDKRHISTAEFKRAAVRLVTDQGYGVAEAARHLGLKASMLGRWKREVEQTMHGAFPGTWAGITGPGGSLSVAGREQARADGARDLNKSPGLLGQRVDVRYAFIMQHQETWPMAVWCEVLDVSRRGFYA